MSNIIRFTLKEVKNFGRLSTIPSIALTAAAILALGLLTRRALTVFDRSWDAPSYHIPYAARLAGICGEDCFVLRPNLDLFFDSFPLAANVLQGVLWRALGFPEATNLLALFSLIILVAYLAWVWEVPLRWAVFGLLAVPYVQIFSSMTYIDLPTNVAATIGLMTLIGILIERRQSISLGAQLTFVVAIAFLGNSKTQMMPVAGAIGLTFLILINTIRPQTDIWFWEISRDTKRGLFFGAFFIAIISATGIRNLIYFNNPVFPVELKFFEFTIFSGVIKPLAANSTSSQLANTPQVFRWVLSVVEYLAFEARGTPYVPGQGSVPQSAPSFRMGGYFASYVIFTVGTCIHLIASLERRFARRLGIFLATLTVGTAAMPASHELRYYMFWMLTLVSFHLSISQTFPIAPGIRLLGRIGIIASFISVTAMTGGRYFQSSGGDSSALIRSLGIQQAVDHQIADGQVVCVDDVRWAFLYTTAFQEHRNYVVRQFEAEDCDLRLKP